MAKIMSMGHETFSEEYYDYRARLAKEIVETTWPYVTTSVADSEHAETVVSEVKISLDSMRYGVGVSYTTQSDSSPDRQTHRFMFDYGGGIRYHTESITAFRDTAELVGIEKIARNEAALNQLAWVSAAIVSSPLAKNFQYLENLLD